MERQVKIHFKSFEELAKWAVFEGCPYLNPKNLFEVEENISAEFGFTNYQLTIWDNIRVVLWIHDEPCPKSI